MLDKEKKLKASLVRARGVITDKYRKLRRNQVMRENEIEERYAPITKSIKQLIDTKESVLRENKLLDNDDEVDNFDFINRDDDLIDFDDVEDVKRTESLKQEKGFLKKPVKIESERKLDVDKKRFYENHNAGGRDEVLRYRNEQNRKIDREKIQSKRKSRRSQITDSMRDIGSFESGLTKDDKKRFYENHNVGGRDEVLKYKNEQNRKNVREKSQTKRKNQRSHFADSVRQKLESKTIVDVKKTRKRCIELAKVAKRKSDKKKHVVAISPEDFDDDGYYRGVLAPKRRKVEVPIDDLQIVSRQRKNIRLGKCLEKKFIPYTQNIVYEHYDNPNELVERLRLLISSKSAGNTNHDQEINSIIEELRERHIIE